MHTVPRDDPDRARKQAELRDRLQNDPVLFAEWAGGQALGFINQTEAAASLPRLERARSMETADMGRMGSS